MKRFLIVLNLVLMVAAIALLSHLVQPRDDHRTAQRRVPIDDLEANPVERPAVGLPWSPLDDETALRVSKGNLFNETRIYFEPRRAPVPDPNGVEAPVVEEPPKEDYKLVGLLRIGDKAVASMVVHVREVAEVRRPGERGNLLQRPGAATPNVTGGKRGIFALGDTVGGIGYVLEDIGPDFVILRRPAKQEGEVDELTVKIDRGDAESSARREEARQDAERKLEEARVAVKQIQDAAVDSGGSDGRQETTSPRRSTEGSTPRTDTDTFDEFRFDDFPGGLNTEDAGTRRGSAGGRRSDDGSRRNEDGSREQRRAQPGGGIPPPSGLPVPPGLPQ